MDRKMKFVFPEWKEWPGRQLYWMEFEFLLWPTKVQTTGGTYRWAWLERVLKISAVNKRVLNDENPSFYRALYDPLFGTSWYSDHFPKWMEHVNWLLAQRKN